MDAENQDLSLKKQKLKKALIIKAILLVIIIAAYFIFYRELSDHQKIIRGFLIAALTVLAFINYKDYKKIK